MLITITEESAHAFETMAAEECMYPLGKSGHFCIGAVEEQNNKNFDAEDFDTENFNMEYFDEDEAVSQGILIFDVIKKGKEVCVNLRWLYVAQNYRGQGIAKELSDEFFRLMDKAKVTIAICDIPKGEEYDEIRTYVEKLKFEFEEKKRYEITTSLETICNIPMLKDKKHGDNVVSIRELDKILWKKLIKQLNQSTLFGNIEDDINLYDKDISCALFQGTQPLGACLIKIQKDGSLMPVALSAVTANSSKILLLLLLYAIDKAKEKYSQDKTVQIKTTTASGTKLAAYFFPEEEPVAFNRGVYRL